MTACGPQDSMGLRCVGALHWQPANPKFGLFCNAFTFIAVPFERYIVSACRKAADRLNR